MLNLSNSSAPASRTRMTLPILITLSRIALTPFFLIILVLQNRVDAQSPAAILLLIPLWVLLIWLEVSDILDGAISRSRNQVSDVGKVLDPLADVLCHLTLFFGFMFIGILPPWIFVLVMYREIAAVGMRMLVALRGEAFAASMIGKIKTIIYAIGCFGVLIVITIRSAAAMVAPANQSLVDILTMIADYLQFAVIVVFIIAVLQAYYSFIVYLLRVRKIL